MLMWYQFSNVSFVCLFRELRNKANIQFGENGTTISAVSNKAYVFERNQSVGDPNVDLIRTINIPLLVSRPCGIVMVGLWEEDGKPDRILYNSQAVIL